jgi:hypothetical protein
MVMSDNLNIDPFLALTRRGAARKGRRSARPDAVVYATSRCDFCRFAAARNQEEKQQKLESESPFTPSGKRSVKTTASI